MDLLAKKNLSPQYEARSVIDKNPGGLREITGSVINEHLLKSIMRLLSKSFTPGLHRNVAMNRW